MKDSSLIEISIKELKFIQVARKKLELWTDLNSK